MAQQPVKGRLEDAVRYACEVALLRGDITTAEDLLGVLENMQARDRIRFQNDRRRANDFIDRARQDVEARKSTRRARFGNWR
jgi:hypothetical protein